jgi:hypothetical protein
LTFPRATIMILANIKLGFILLNCDWVRLYFLTFYPALGSEDRPGLQDSNHSDGPFTCRPAATKYHRADFV